MSTAVFDGDRNSLMSIADLACTAAEELDQLSNGQENELTAVRGLTDYLRLVTQEASENQNNAVASMRLTLVRKAMIGPSLQPHELPTLLDVLDRATTLMGKLENSSGPDGELYEMRDFCLALSKVVAAESRMRAGAPQPMRYRK